MAKIRPLTASEERAAEIMREGIAAHLNLGAVAPAPLLRAVVEAESVPLAEQPAVAIEVEPEPEAAPDAEIEDAPGPTEPEPILEVEDVPDVEPDEAPGSDGDAQCDDVAGVLARGLASSNLRALDLARAIARYVGELHMLLDVDEKTRAVREEIARLEAELAAKKLELAEMNGGIPAPVAARPLPKHVAEASRIDRALYYSTDVREWAQNEGLDVAAKGCIAKPIVEAYLAAH